MLVIFPHRHRPLVPRTTNTKLGTVHCPSLEGGLTDPICTYPVDTNTRHLFQWRSRTLLGYLRLLWQCKVYSFLQHARRRRSIKETAEQCFGAHRQGTTSARNISADGTLDGRRMPAWSGVISTYRTVHSSLRHSTSSDFFFSLAQERRIEANTRSSTAVTELLVFHQTLVLHFYCSFFLHPINQYYNITLASFPSHFISFSLSSLLHFFTSSLLHFFTSSLLHFQLGLISCELMRQCFEVTLRTATMIAPFG